jgi:uncharacterized protein YjbI with pentapeptide repeats
MATKPKPRVEPRIEFDLLTGNFEEQIASGHACDAIASKMVLPPLESPRGQPVRVDRCVWREITLSNSKAARICMQDARIEGSDLANMNLMGASLDRVEIVATRLTGATFTEAHLKSVLIQDCKLDLALLRMARLQQCVFERCNLTDADFYAADLSGTVFRECDMSRADFSHAKLTGADIRNCRLDGLRGMPAAMDGLIISPDQAPLLITLFGVRVEW